MGRRGGVTVEPRPTSAGRRLTNERMITIAEVLPKR